MAEPAGTIRTALITGATSGIGRALAEKLLCRGISVIGVGRSEERCQAAEAMLAQSSPAACVRYLVADLSLQADVRTLRPQIEAQLSAWGQAGLDALVNNAGAFTFHRTLTAEGIEMQWAVNHLAPFLLTHELLPLLRAAPSARVVTVSSASHYRTTINWNNVELANRYNPLRAYQQSKLANVLFTMELRRRLGAASCVHAFAADPGLVNTRIGSKSGSILARLVWDLRRRSGISPAESARGIAALLLDPDAPAASDVYWKHGKPVAPNPYALDKDAGRRLWELSLFMCSLAEQGGAGE
ncbi:MAG: SDR family NAD(P)-dependent oxidoreductase [Anaerolineales bacterium]|nr:SDR family NAD(P)-dependent oxidoreductase [Anaerolineales bacterium]